MNDSDYVKIGGSKTGAVIRLVVLFSIIAVIGILMILSIPKHKNLDAIWDERTIIGDKNAKNHFVMTTDIVCPYCDYFSRAIMANQDEFEQYLKDNDIVYEMRITDFLNEYGEAGIMSEQAAEAAICATEEDKFWDFYHNAMKSLDEDYHSKGIGNAKGAPMMVGIDSKYWLTIGKEVGLGDSFEDCYTNHKMLGKVRENTANTVKVMEQAGSGGGMPYFLFNGLETSGFDTSWSWNEIKAYYFEAGLKN